ncbi:hypothetical protein Fmac_016738 [Flemingia macrophylla]|uniref:Uncharacterized protein n=1 Tax=Flemingia macrophylla TaxID=520843 RepID=A0ABD1MKF4_9FABA
MSSPPSVSGELRTARAMGGDGEVTVFADTNLGTRIAFNAPPDITAASLKTDFEKAHISCLPDIGEIQVNGLMVKRKSCFYYLPDSLPMKYAFPAMRGTWTQQLARMKIRQGATMRKKKPEAFQPSAYLVEEHETTNHVSEMQEEKGSSYENHMQSVATRMSEIYPCRFGDKSTGTANESPHVMPENKGENLVELHTNSMQGSLSKMSTQVISVTGIISKYFSGFNGIDNFSISSNSDVTSRAVHSEIEVQSTPRERSFSKRESDSLSQFTPKTPHVLHAPLLVDLVSKISGDKNRKLKVGKHLPSGGKNRKSKVGKRLSGSKNRK